MFDFGTEGHWPVDPDALRALQARLASARPRIYRHATPGTAVGAVFLCFPLGGAGMGATGDPGWAGAAVAVGDTVTAQAVARGTAGAPYRPGLLAAREGPLLAAAVAALPETPPVLLVNATGRDHPRRAGLALHLGAALDLPTVGVTHRPLHATGAWPAPRRGATSPLVLEGEAVGAWLTTRDGARPLAVHPAWGTDLETAVAVVLAATGDTRTPTPLRAARQLAREARALGQGRAEGPAGPLLARH